MRKKVFFLLSLLLSISIAFASIPMDTCAVNADTEDSQNSVVSSDNEGKPREDDSEDGGTSDSEYDPKEGNDADSNDESDNEGTDENEDAFPGKQSEEGDNVDAEEPQEDSDEDKAPAPFEDEKTVESSAGYDSLIFESSISEFKLLIYAPAGTFPEGTELKVTDVSENSEERELEIKDRIQRDAEMGYYVENIAVFDISFFCDGVEVQPEDGKVSVIINVDDEMEEDALKTESELKAFHVEEQADGQTDEQAADDSASDKGDGQTVQVTEQNAVDPEDILPDDPESVGIDEEDIAEADIAFEAEHFSEYAVTVMTEWTEDEDEQLFDYDEAEWETLREEDKQFETLPENSGETALTAEDGLVGDSLNEVNAASLPSSYRTADLPNLRNQGSYGLCWAHAALSMGEMQYMKDTGSDINLSELHLAYFQNNSVVDPLGGIEGDYIERTSETSKFNYGGNNSRSMVTLSTWQGAAAEDSSKYTGYESTNGNYIETNGLDDSIAYDDAMHLTDVYFVDPVNNMSGTKQLVYDYGGVSISFCACTSYYGAISNKLYDEANNCYYTDTEASINHAVTIVGWDDNFSADNFATTPSGNGAWLIRNSWTTDGETGSDYNSYMGYFWLSYYDKTIDTSAAAFVYDDADNYDHNYQYDGGYSLIWYTRQIKAANVFKISDESESGEILKAVSFFSVCADQSYTIKIYKGLSSATNPESGTLVDTITGNYTYSGYHTVSLNTPVSLAPGELYSVVVDTLGLQFERDYDYGNGTYCHAIAKAGQSFYYNGSWIDNTVKGYGNYKIKAFTDDDLSVIPTGVSFDDASLSSGKTMHVKETFTPAVTVSPADATNKRVTWSSSNTDVASVDASTGKITALSAGTAQITVTTVSGGMTASFALTVLSNVSSLSINDQTGTDHLIGDTFDLTLSVLPASLAGEAEWSSSDADIATVSETGRVSAVGIGTVTITVAVEDKTANIAISCLPKNPSNISTNTTKEYAARIVWQDAEYADYYIVVNPDGTRSAKIYPGSVHEYVHGSYSAKVGISVQYTLLTYKNGVYNSRNIALTIDDMSAQNEYTITYHLNGGQNDSSNPAVHYGGAAVIIADASAPVGYNFDGWYFDEGFTEAYSSTVAFPEEDVDLYAKFSEITYKLRIVDYNGAVNKEVSLKYNAKYMLTNSSVRTGYRLTGWTYNTGSGNVNVYEGSTVTRLGTVQDQIVTLDQVWAKVSKYSHKTYKVTYNLNGGKNSGSNPKKYSSYSTTIVLKAATRKGYTFAGWYGNKKCTGSPVSVINCARTGNITLYAKWTAIKYTVTFANLEGASHPYANDTVTYTIAKAVKLKKPTKTGYTFAGWYKDASLKKKITSISKGSTGNKTLYAKWTPNKYTITYMANGGKGKVKDQSCTYNGGSFNLRANKFTKKGYHFVGWALSKKGQAVYSDRELITANLTAKKNGTVKLYAVWERN